MAKRDLATGDLAYFKGPTRFIFGKSLVSSNVTGDVFEGITAAAVAYVPHPGYHPESRQGLSIKLGGAFAFYHRFWPGHGLEHLASLVSPEVEIGSRVLHVPVLIHNDTDTVRQVTLSPELPEGWKAESGFLRYPVRAHATYPADCVLDGPAGHDGTWQAVSIRAESSRSQVGIVRMRVHLAQGGLPQ